MLVLTVRDSEVMRIEHAGEVLEVKVRVQMELRQGHSPKRRQVVCISGPKSFDVQRLPSEQTELGRELQAKGMEVAKWSSGKVAE